MTQWKKGQRVKLEGDSGQYLLIGTIVDIGYLKPNNNSATYAKVVYDKGVVEPPSVSRDPGSDGTWGLWRLMRMDAIATIVGHEPEPNAEFTGFELEL